jgi:hypothetical protein
MSEETRESAPIGLEVDRRTKVGCAVAIVVAVVGFAILSAVLQKRGKMQAMEAASELYAFAKLRDFTRMKGLTTESGIQTLRKAEQVNGSIDSWNVLQTTTHLMGRPTEVQMHVIRRGRPYVDVLALLDNRRVAVVVEYPQEDWEKKVEERAIRVIAK